MWWNSFWWDSPDCLHLSSFCSSNRLFLWITSSSFSLSRLIPVFTLFCTCFSASFSDICWSTSSIPTLLVNCFKDFPTTPYSGCLFQITTSLYLEVMECFLLAVITSVQFSHSVMSDSLWPHGLQHARLSCPSPTPGACSNSCSLSWWYHPIISSSVDPFSSCLQSFPASGSFLWVSSSHQVAEVLELQLQYQSFQWIFRTDFL